MKHSLLRLDGTIRSLRKEAKLKQKVLAENMDISPTYLCLIEHDKERPSVRLIEAIAAQLRTSPEEILLRAYESGFSKTPLQGKKRECVKNILREIVLSLR